MSWCCRSLCLLVLLGVAVASTIPSQFVSEKMQQNQESIATMLKLKGQEIGSKPLFDSVIKGINTSCQRKVHVMNATLDVYLRIFSSILQSDQHHNQNRTTLLDHLSNDERSKVKLVVTTFQRKIEVLRGQLGQVNHDRDDVLSKLRNIKVNEPMDQKKALAEFSAVYQAASVMGHTPPSSA